MISADKLGRCEDEGKERETDRDVPAFELGADPDSTSNPSSSTLRDIQLNDKRPLCLS